MNYKIKLNDKVTGHLPTGDIVEGIIWNIDYDKSQVEILRNGMKFHKHWFSIIIFHMKDIRVIILYYKINILLGNTFHNMNQYSTP